MSFRGGRGGSFGGRGGGGRGGGGSFGGRGGGSFRGGRGGFGRQEEGPPAEVKGAVFSFLFLLSLVFHS